MALKEHVTAIRREPYWLSLVDYYYDHIHWDQTPRITIHEWLQRDFGAYTRPESDFIYFKEQSRANWFHLRWHPASLIDRTDVF